MHYEATLLNSGVNVRYTGTCLTRLQPDVYFHVFGGFLGVIYFHGSDALDEYYKKKKKEREQHPKEKANKRDVQMETLI